MSIWPIITGANFKYAAENCTLARPRSPHCTSSFCCSRWVPWSRVTWDVDRATLTSTWILLNRSVIWFLRPWVSKWFYLGPDSSMQHKQRWRYFCATALCKTHRAHSSACREEIIAAWPVWCGQHRLVTKWTFVISIWFCCVNSLYNLVIVRRTILQQHDIQCHLRSSKRQFYLHLIFYSQNHFEFNVNLNVNVNLKSHWAQDEVFFRRLSIWFDMSIPFRSTLVRYLSLTLSLLITFINFLPYKWMQAVMKSPTADSMDRFYGSDYRFYI